MKKKRTVKKQAQPAKPRVVKTITVRRSYKEILIVLGLTFLVYIPSLRGDFVNWDDPDYVNETFFKFSDFKTLVTTPIQGNYHPLTVLSLALNYAISGMNAWSYHLVNLLLHLLNCFLVFRLTLMLSSNALIAFVTSLLFGIHPMHVESVAWVTERKDVLYSAFFLSGLIAYIKFIESSRAKHYVLAIVFLILALLSKPAAVVFPLVLFCIDLFRQRKLSMKLVIEKLPFIGVCLILGIMTFIAQQEKGALNTFAFSAGTRALMGFYGIMMYIIKAVLPLNLSPFYPYAPINEALPTAYFLAPIFFAGLVLVALLTWKRTRVVAFGLLFYIVNLLLVLQFLPVGSAIIADRYTYIPYIGLFFIFGWLLSRFVKSNVARAYYIIAPVAIILCILTYRQAGFWINSAALWDHAIDVTPSSRAYDNRARLFGDEHNTAKALEYYNQSLQLNAIDKEAYTNRGNIYFNANNFNQAYPDYKKALEIDSNYYPALDNLGALYAMRGQFDSAIYSLSHCLRVNEAYSSAYRNRALVWMELKKFDEALSDFNSFLKYRPEDPDIYNTMGICYRSKGDFPQALTVINKALSIRQDPHFYLNRSYAYFGLKNVEQARKDALAAKAGGVRVEEPFAKSLGLQ